MLVFFLAPFYLLFHLYLSQRIYHWLVAIHSVFGNIGILLPLFFVFVLIFVSPVPAAFGYGKMKIFMKKINNLWFGAIIYLTLFLLIADIWKILYLLVKTGKLINIIELLTGNCAAVSDLMTITCGCFVLAGMLVLTCYGTWNASNIRTTHYDVEIMKKCGECRDDTGSESCNESNIGMQRTNKLKIGLIADLHIGGTVGLHHVRKICRVIDKMQPDFLVIAGDIFDNDYSVIDHPNQIASEFRKLTKDCRAYACWGNHDIAELIFAGFTFSSKKHPAVCDPKMEQFLKDAGICLLKDETVLLEEGIYLIGRQDASCKEKSGTIRLTPSELTVGLNPQFPVIVIDHQPSELSELADAGVDLDLSGHTHDGQIFPGNLTTRAGWKNSCGKLRIGNMTSIVTSGAGIWGPSQRIGTHSEVVEVVVHFS